VRIHVKYVPRVASQLRRGAIRLSDTRSLLTGIGRRVAYSMRKNIDQSRTPDGKAYPGLSRPRRPVPPHNPSTRPLVDSGRLIRSINYVLDGKSAVEIGYETQYGLFQNRGTKFIPARQFVGLRAKDIPPSILRDFVISAFHDEYHS
jgi:phage virion morphogenesis protein